jgi:hypothetical protein
MNIIYLFPTAWNFGIDFIALAPEAHPDHSFSSIASVLCNLKINFLCRNQARSSWSDQVCCLRLRDSEYSDQCSSPRSNQNRDFSKVDCSGTIRLSHSFCNASDGPNGTARRDCSRNSLAAIRWGLICYRTCAQHRRWVSGKVMIIRQDITEKLLWDKIISTNKGAPN